MSGRHSCILPHTGAVFSIAVMRGENCSLGRRGARYMELTRQAGVTAPAAGGPPKWACKCRALQTFSTQLPGHATHGSAASCVFPLSLLPGWVKTCLTDASVTAHLQQSGMRGGGLEPTGLAAQIKLRAEHLYWYRQAGAAAAWGETRRAAPPRAPAQLEVGGRAQQQPPGRTATGPWAWAGAGQPAASAVFCVGGMRGARGLLGNRGQGKFVGVRMRG